MSLAPFNFLSSLSDRLTLARVALIWVLQEMTRSSGGTQMATPVLGVDTKDPEQALELRQCCRDVATKTIKPHVTKENLSILEPAATWAHSERASTGTKFRITIVVRTVDRAAVYSE